MNKSFKTVWNDALGAWVATPEHQAARGKRSGSVAKAVLASAVGLMATTGAFASGFDGGDVSQGSPGPANGVAIGSGSSANYNYGAALGPGASAMGTGDVAVGADAKVNSGAPNGDGGVLGSTAVGSNAHALAASATSLGGQANASGTQSTAIGSHRAGGGQREFRGRLRRQRGRGGRRRNRRRLHCKRRRQRGDRESCSRGRNLQQHRHRRAGEERRGRQHFHRFANR